MLNATPKGYQQITDLSAASGLTAPAGARLALIRVEGADVRWRDDGTDPTATVGMLLKATDPAPFEYGGSLSKLKLIQVAAGAIVNVAYYGL